MENNNSQSVRRAVHRRTPKEIAREIWRKDQRRSAIGHAVAVRNWLRAGRIEEMADRIEQVIVYLQHSQLTPRHADQSRSRTPGTRRR